MEIKTHKNLGVPYMGSKNFIAPRIIEAMPPADTFVDLFAGGCAVTHAAMLSGKYKNFIANDLDGMGVELFQKAVNGEFKNCDRWVSREEFFEKNNSDPFVKLCWSFGNSGTAYMYSKEIEPYKKLFHEACFAKTPFDVKRGIRKMLFWLWQNGCMLLKGDVSKKQPLIPKKFFDRLGIPQEKLESFQSMLQLQSLERLRSLQSLQSLQSLSSDKLTNCVFSKLDYRDVSIPPNSIAYADIPYKGTAKYSVNGKEVKFDHEVFYEWADKQEQPVYVSSYEMPDTFSEIFSTDHTSRFSSKKSFAVKEKLFVQKRFADVCKSKIPEQLTLDLKQGT